MTRLHNHRMCVTSCLAASRRMNALLDDAESYLVAAEGIIRWVGNVVRTHLLVDSAGFCKNIDDMFLVLNMHITPCNPFPFFQERRFPEQLGGRYLTYGHVLSQMKGRFDKELRGARRPAVRKVLNRDCTASMPMILCVSQILRFNSKFPKDSKQKPEEQHEIRLQLTDGWYAVPALLDNALTSLVQQGKIPPGSKIMVCNGQLVGSDDGIDPLDDDYYSDRRTCPVFLKIAANSTRLAKWDAKLGFVHPKYVAHQGGSLLVKSLCDIFPDGGAIPVTDLVICKKYPKLYLEKIVNLENQSIVSNHLTEAEEAARQRELDTTHQCLSEKYADKVHDECSEVRFEMLLFS